MNTKKAIVFIIVVVLCCHINAQTLSGEVYDKDTKQPVMGVHVYFDGTTVFAVTNDSGRFELSVHTVNNMINPKLVLHHVAYNTVVIDYISDDFPERFYIQERSYTFDELIIRPSPFYRNRMLKAFKEQFLGVTRAGKSCKIENEDDLKLWFDRQTNSLMASSDHPIVVVNEYLGYKISIFQLDFRTEYTGVTLNTGRVRRTFFTMTTSYIDLYPNDDVIKIRRDAVYENSRAFFLKNFANNTLNEAGFQIYKGFRIDDIRELFTIKDTLSQKVIKPVRSSNVTASNNLGLRTGGFKVVYRGNVSFVKILADDLLVDKYGNVDQIDKVQYSGVMGKYRVGDMLPFDYEPACKRFQ